MTLCILALATACAEKEDIDPNLTFTLLIENNLTRSVDVYIKPQLDLEEPFALSATITSGQTGEILDLIIREPYRIRFVNEGRPIEEFFEERAIGNLDVLTEELRLTLEE